MLFRSVQLGFEQSKSDVQAALTQLNLASSDKDFDTQGLEVRRLLIKLEEAIESHKELEYGPVDCYRVLSGSLAADRIWSSRCPAAEFSTILSRVHTCER